MTREDLAALQELFEDCIEASLASRLDAIFEATAALDKAREALEREQQRIEFAQGRRPPP